jgi:nitroreductase
MAVDLSEAMRTTGSVRAFRPEPVDDAVLVRILDQARFAGSGGNRQGWHVVVVRDPATRRALRDLYVPVWAEYVDGYRQGVVPYSIDWTPPAAPPEPAPNEFADHLDEVPALLLVCADLRALAVTDRDLDRQSVVGGASVYPFVQNVLLAARGEGLGGVLTTLLVRAEPAVAALIGLPPTHALVAVLALGHPVHQPTKLSRRPVASFTTVDRFDGPPLG